MTIDTDAIMALLSEVAGDEQIRITAKQSFKGAMIAGLGSFIGGVMAGPIGIAAGAALGGGVGAAMTAGTFKPLYEVLDDMPLDSQKRIADDVDQIMRQLQITDIVQVALIAQAVTNGDFTNQVLLRQFIQQSVLAIQNEVLREQSRISR